MSDLGPKAEVTAPHRISALPPMADIDHHRIDVRFVPTTDMSLDGHPM
jgi:hypothetical protein